MAILASGWLAADAVATATNQVGLCRSPDGRTWLAPAEQSAGPGCAPLVLPLPPSEVRWVHWLPQRPPAAPARVVVEGSRKAGAFAPSTARLAEPARPERAPIVPLGSPIGAEMKARPFGTEERAVAELAVGEWRIACKAGARPAGVLLEPRHQRFPRAAQMALLVESTGDPGFRIGFAASGGIAGERALGSVPIRVPVPPEDRFRDNPAIVVVCPPQAATVRIAGLRLEPAREAGAILRSAWAWKPELWRQTPQALLAAAEEHRVGRLFVSAEIADGALQHESAFAAFVAQARARRIAVTVVEGDPAMALAEGRTAAVRRLRVLAGYQRRAAPEARLAGIQYDIEPYLLPAYAADPAPILAGWAETLRALRQAAGSLPLDMALPFWIVDDERAANLVLPAVAASATSLTAMAYRTDLAALQQAAEPLLAWGAARGLPIHVALETGPLDDEVSRLYRETPAGELWLMPHAGGSLLLYGPGGAPPPGIRSLGLERETVAAASRVSFLGDSRQMNSVAERALPMLGAWTSFSGLAFHGLLE